MHTKKILITTIDFTPKELYSPNIDEIILFKLKERYVGKCFQSMLITSIERIIMRSLIRMYENMISGGGYSDIKFEISGIIYSQGEVIHGCKITDIQHETSILAESKYADIGVLNDPTNKASLILKINQLRPVVVQKVGYRPNHTAISVIGSIFIPRKPDTMYQFISSGLTMDDSEKLDILMQEIDHEEKLHTAFAKDKRYAFFQDIMSCWRNPQNYEKSSLVKTLSMKPIRVEYTEIAKVTTGLCILPAEDSLINKRFFHSNTDSMPDSLGGISEEEIITEGSLMSFVAPVCIRYLLYMQCLRGFMDAYPTQESIKADIDYWRICKSYQE